MKSIGILLTDHQSINEEIILKSLNYIKKSKLKKIYIIGDNFYFQKIFKKIKKINKVIFLNIKYKRKNSFKYLNDITNESLKLHEQKKISKIINMPLNKKKFLGKKFIGFTEFFSKKLKNLNNSNMLLFNNNFSVCPLTTHIQIKDVNKKITKSNFVKAINNINTFYNKILKKKPQIIVLGLNPHCSKDFSSKTVDHKLLSKEILLLKKNKINIIGPVSADTAFLKYKNKVFVGMYHDQVLIPFKLINKFDGINLTIGNKIIRMSPDHGTAETLIKKRKYISNQSFIKCLKFCEKY